MDSEFVAGEVQFGSVDLGSNETQVAGPCWASEPQAGLRPRTEH